MVSTTREVQIDEFDGFAKPIFDHVRTEVRDPNWVFNWEYFSTEWKKWMELGVARTWGADGAILGGIFTRDLYSGTPRATIIFWAATPSARRAKRSIAVLEVFENFAKASGAKIGAAQHHAVSPKGLGLTYQRRGYGVAETIWTK